VRRLLGWSSANTVHSGLTHSVVMPGAQCESHNNTLASSRYTLCRQSALTVLVAALTR
jgi:hypothetical protein